ncbi:MAG TPA: nodulation protein NfeD [Gammaproteobacteria bacterium]|nr:nodulation protein NfeD [Gammaproteobacteria bacterium]
MNKLVRALLSLICLGCAALAAGAQQSPDEESDRPRAVLLEIRGAIGPATSDYVVRGIEAAEAGGARLVILEMDTPGGLDSAMRDIIKAILNSEVPVATFVYPSGSRAASAGTYILFASHVAAMAPATNMGAATPVQIGGAPAPPDGDAPKGPAEEPDGGGEGGPDDGDAADGEPGTDGDARAPEPVRDSERSGSAMERKAINDAVAYIRGLADRHGRNADWAERAVRDAETISARQAVEENVVDLVARDHADLLEQIDGRTVSIGGGERTLETGDMLIERVEPDWRTRLLSVITDPTVAYLLMLIGIYGLIFEGYNPGAIVPGVVGAICLLLALFAFQVLPVNYAGLALILLGIVLMIGEMFMASFGALGIGGIIAFVIGSVILIDTDVPGFGVSRTLIATIALAGGLLLFAIIAFAVHLRNKPVVTGQEEMIGALATADGDFTGRGRVRLYGELWNAYARAPVRQGDKVRVTAIDGLTLEVEPTSIREI